MTSHSYLETLSPRSDQLSDVDTETGADTGIGIGIGIGIGHGALTSLLLLSEKAVCPIKRTYAHGTRTLHRMGTLGITTEKH